ncbi:murein transglycosylase A [Oceanicella sp. SM1341]|uniref:murein transglycosylase A n=1 Tax=Oceanicella sp. SM1341 TaxID=1548889 RepID=UPI001E38A039|nr:MltA domain-containing protein [Oceanicella sp. SM1341]
MRTIGFGELKGWMHDDHAAGLATFLTSCDLLRPVPPETAEDWQAVCAEARGIEPEDAKAFFERAFVPMVDGRRPESLFTGYFEPELEGARERSESFAWPLYALPEDAPKSDPWFTRAEIEAGALAGRGLELVWLRDPVAAFFLHVQGSGRVRLQNGHTIRLGYAGRNNQPYRSIGRYLLDNGLMKRGSISAQGIADWVKADPDSRLKVLNENPSFIFFQEREIDPAFGPVGALGVPLTPERSVAVDPERVALGSPVWVETAGRMGPIRKLMVAQDRGAAVTGAQRADIFFGWGLDAFRSASVQNSRGRLVRLVPRAAAARLER